MHGALRNIFYDETERQVLQDVWRKDGGDGMTKREFLDTVFALVPKDANKIMDAFDEYVESNEPHWIPVTERLPEPRIDVWCNSDLGQMVGYYDETIETWFGRDYLELLVNAWMPLPEPFKGVTT